MQKLKDIAFNIRQKYAYEPEEKVIKAFDAVNHVKGVVIPIKLLDQIAEYSYNIDDYQQLILILMKRLNTQAHLQKDLLKTLTIVDYLMKYGCSGCIDDFKEWIHIFSGYSVYMIDSDANIPKLIRDKSNHIFQLLTNKQRLYMEKHLAKEIKLKMQLNRQRLQAISSSSFQNNQQMDQTQQQVQAEQDRLERIEDFAENYIFKYLDKFNDKLEAWGDKVNSKIDKLIDRLGLVDGLADPDNTMVEEYVFPESCMEDGEVIHVSKDVPTQKQQTNFINSPTMRPPPQLLSPSLKNIKKNEDLLTFDSEEKQSASDLIDL